MALAVLAGNCDEEERYGDVLQLEPVKERERGGRARPVQQLAQLVQEGDGLEDVERHRAKVVHVAGKYKCVPPSAAPAWIESCHVSHPVSRSVSQIIPLPAARADQMLLGVFTQHNLQNHGSHPREGKWQKQHAMFQECKRKVTRI